jgi:hypothetical protein
MSDAELNRAALLIAKLLIRTREGKLQWTNAARMSAGSFHRAGLDEGLEAHLSRDDKGLGFKLCGPPAVDLPAFCNLAGVLGGRDSNEVISVALDHSYGKAGLVESPETIVYRDLAELIFLAENPKSVSDDLRYQQALTYLDKLSA